jgi:hypothetical protein
LLIGVVIAVRALVTGYGVEFVVQLPKQPVFHFAGIDPKAGVTGGFLMMIRGAVSIVVALLGMVLVKCLAERLQMPEVEPWGQWAVRQ